jgi:molybdopterin-guanine dinucleotide biosynthesis protein A
MGTNKALLPYRGCPLVGHMQRLLREAGCAEVHISGTVPGYICIPDTVSYDGPARAMTALLKRFKGQFYGLLFVPVDMPLIPAEVLRTLMTQNDSVYFEGYPLPALITTLPEKQEPRSVKGLLESVRARAIPLPENRAGDMMNVNTREEWEAVAL